MIVDCNGVDLRMKDFSSTPELDLEIKIHEAFATVPFPGLLHIAVYSCDNVDPDKTRKRFSDKTDWTQLDGRFLDESSSDLFFFDAGGLQFFLPAYMTANISYRFERVELVVFLTNGLTDRGKVDPIMPGKGRETTCFDFKRSKFSCFTISQLEAIVAFLTFMVSAGQEHYAGDVSEAVRNCYQPRILELHERNLMRAAMTCSQS